MKIVKYTFASLLMAGFLSSCSSDYLSTEPTSSVSEKVATETLTGLEGMVNGLHSMTYIYNFAQVDGTGMASLNYDLDALGDDYINTKPAFLMSYYRWESHINPEGAINYYAWDYLYTLILHANKIINRSAALTNVDEAELSLYQGTAYAYRAMAYHKLVQLFGKRFVKGAANDNLGVILRLTEEEQFEPKERATVAETYKQINADMAKALELMAKAKAPTGKNCMSLATANGLAARIALTQEDWAGAEKYATQAIEQAKKQLGVDLQVADDLINGFNNWDSKEWMWAYKQANDQDLGYIHPFVTMSYNFAGHNSGVRFAINRTIFDKMGKKDVRRKLWVALDQGLDNLPADYDASYFEVDKQGDYQWEYTGQSVKYKAQAKDKSFGDLYIMRVAEMYYIKAEAEYRQGKIGAAQTTLGTIMATRDPEYKATAYTGEELWNEIYRNKRIDLWGEGSRFFDMKRLKEVPNRLSAANFKYLTPADKKMAEGRNTGKNARAIPTTIDDPAWEFAIPYGEIKGNKLCKQNPLKSL